MIRATPTKRAVIEPLRLCQLRCKFCYHIYDDMKSVKQIADVKNDITAAVARGNNYIDVTGGEPYLYPELSELIQHCHNNCAKVCVITNALAGSKLTALSLENGLDGLLVSVHGMEATHNELVQASNARKLQERFLEQVSEKVHLRFNFVLNRFNQAEILETSKWMATYKPKIVNFINMNPHHDWAKHSDETRNVVADLRFVEPILNDAISYLEDLKIGVNVRYYPMCRIAENYRRCVCNDLHVSFDPFEWDYKVQPKTVEAFERWMRGLSAGTELQGNPCGSCDLQFVCGGINKLFNAATNGTMIDKVTNVGKISQSGYYLYRQHNVLTLQEPA